MTSSAETVSALRRLLADGGRGSPVAMPAQRFGLGVTAVDAALHGGLDRAGLHEIFPETPGDAAAATLVAVAMAVRAATGSDRQPDRPVLWIDTALSAQEDGQLWPPGLADLGLAAERLIRVAARQGPDALRAAGEALGSPALGAVVLELRGKVPALDLTAARRLSLAAQSQSVPCLLLRSGADPMPSPALSRWSVAARPRQLAPVTSTETAHLPPPRLRPDRHRLSAAVFHLALLRHRHGGHGAWDLTWCPDAISFRQPLSQPALPQPVDRPDPPREQIKNTRQ